jgi:hypothetical protein
MNMSEEELLSKKCCGGTEGSEPVFEAIFETQNLVSVKQELHPKHGNAQFVSVT